VAPSLALGAELAAIPRVGEVPLTPGHKQALLKLRGTEVCKAVLTSLRENGQLAATGRDYYALARLGLAIHKGSYHVIARHARWKADQIARTLARELKLHVLTYDLGGPGRAAFTRCCCGWVAYRSRSISNYAVLMGRDASQHLEHIGAT